jgi:hypothetical protein
MSKQYRFRIHEVEHESDAAEALNELDKAGCTRVTIIARDYEAECILVEATLPEGWTLDALEKQTELCL